MTPFMELPVVCMPFFCLAFLLASVASLYCMIASTVYRVPARYLGVCAILLFCSLLPTVALTEGCIALYSGSEPARMIVWLLRIPAVPFALIALLLLTADAQTILRSNRWRNEHISRLSIKESVDLLPMGLCFCYTDGIPRLVNRQMDDLCRTLTGGMISDADDFWRTVTSGTLEPDCDRIRGDECPIIRTGDGAVWTFERKQIELNGVPVCQLTATDTTEEYRLVEQLKAENLRLSEMKKRLKRYHDTVREVTREREILNAKVRIHDELGQALVASRRVLTVPVPRDEQEAVAGLWKKSVSVLNKDYALKSNADEYARLTNAAQAIGISIRWIGEKPGAETYAARILQRMTHECLTNAVRHAGSTELSVSVRREGGQWTYLCTNNGDVPHSPVNEGGGLGGLRCQVEQAGGEMQIAHTPRFELHITIPEECEAELWTNTEL